jgi:hypothetical protein
MLIDKLAAQLIAMTEQMVWRDKLLSAVIDASKDSELTADQRSQVVHAIAIEINEGLKDGFSDQVINFAKEPFLPYAKKLKISKYLEKVPILYKTRFLLLLLVAGSHPAIFFAVHLLYSACT